MRDSAVSVVGPSVRRLIAQIRFAGEQHDGLAPATAARAIAFEET